jgi:hypothetical protein
MGAIDAQPNRLPKIPRGTEIDDRQSRSPQCCCCGGEIHESAPEIDFGCCAQVDGARVFFVVVLVTVTVIETTREEPAA